MYGQPSIKYSNRQGECEWQEIGLNRKRKEVERSGDKEWIRAIDGERKGVFAEYRVKREGIPPFLVMLLFCDM